LSGYGTATGGTSSTITVGNQSYTLLSFTSDANLTVSTGGLFDVLLVGGGGGAGYPENGYNGSGGGGGGGVTSPTNFITLNLAAGTYSIDVGAGGATGGGSVQHGFVGSESKIGSILAVSGGGFGGCSDGNANKHAGNGASGGGAPNITSTNIGYSITPLYGNNGGTGTANLGASSACGGGGGAGAVGGNASSTTGGAGGNGLDISGFIGGSTYYAGAGGGGGGTGAGGAAGNGGVAGKSSGTGNAGVNYGAGGGGTAGASAGGAGAAGVVYVRFKI